MTSFQIVGNNFIKKVCIKFVNMYFVISQFGVGAVELTLHTVDFLNIDRPFDRALRAAIHKWGSHEDP